MAQQPGKKTTKKSAKAPKKNGVTADEILGKDTVNTADFIIHKKPVVSEVPIYQDTAIAMKAQEARKKAATAAVRASGSPDNEHLALAAAELDQEAAELEAQVVKMVFHFKALGRQRVEDLLAEHKPTEEQEEAYAAELKKQGRPNQDALAYNSDTFPPALMAAACDQLTEEQAFEIWNSDEWSEGELGQLFSTAWAVNKMIL